MKRLVAAPAACSLALVLALWASIDLAAFHVRRGGNATGCDGAAAAETLSAHEASHLCAFTSVAHTAHGAAFATEPAPLVPSERLAPAAVPARPVPGRTASGLAPPA